MGTYEERGKALQAVWDREGDAPPEPAPHEVLEDHIQDARRLLNKVSYHFCLNEMDKASHYLESAILDHLDEVEKIIDTEKGLLKLREERNVGSDSKKE